MYILKKLCSFIIGILLRWILFSPLCSRLDHPILEKLKDRQRLSAYDDELLEGLRWDLMPRHVAVIPDGNRSWAEKRSVTLVEAYYAGLKSIERIAKLVMKLEIPVISLILNFSDIGLILPRDYFIGESRKVLEKILLKKGIDTLMRHDARVSVIGDISIAPQSVKKVIQHIEEATKNNTKVHLIIVAMTFNGQNDILQATRSIAKKVKDGHLKSEDITNSLIEKELQITNITGTPCPDLLIRTGGTRQFGNCYLWQSAYTELHFTDTHWPDFGEDEFFKALRSFQKRKNCSESSDDDD